MLSCEQVKTMIQEGIPGAAVEVNDLTGTSDHFDVRVVSTLFEGKSLIEQHKMVHRSVGDHLGNAIHALQIKTSTS